jgi:hypothetical protein
MIELMVDILPMSRVSLTGTRKSHTKMTRKGLCINWETFFDCFYARDLKWANRVAFFRDLNRVRF